MKLVGMLDSPYVRRVAVSLQLLGLRFEHQSMSVFRDRDAFHRINPVVRAPTLVCDDGAVLMDSTLILQYAEALARPRTLMPEGLPQLQRDLQLTGLALAATEKCVQIVYERGLRPPERQHEPWAERVTTQMQAAFAELERWQELTPLSAHRDALRQAHVSVAVGWHFARQMVPQLLPLEAYPRLAAFSAAAEALPEFQAAPHGEGSVRGG
jgi:glutathione S-transferase